MSTITTICETVALLSGVAVVCHRIEQALLAKNGYDTRGFFRPTARPKASEPAPGPTLWTEKDEAAAAALWRAAPLAFWLYPNRHGDRPEPYRAYTPLVRTGEPLPCGCSGDVRTRAYPTGGWDMGRYAECKTCGGCWDYAEKYGEDGDPRKMHPRSEPVDWPNGNKLLAKSNEKDYREDRTTDGKKD